MDFSNLKSLFTNQDTQNLENNPIKKTKDRLGKKTTQALKEDRKRYTQTLDELLQQQKEKSKENTKELKQDAKNLLYRLKSTVGNINANLASTAPEFGGLIGSALVYPFAKIHSKLTGGPNDVFLPMLEENPLSKIGESTERFTRDYYGIKQIEDMDRADQIINLASMFVGPTASKSDKFLTAALKPGLQITKDAKLGTKLAQVGTQIGLPAGMNEAMRYQQGTTGVFGDYTPKEEEQDQNLVLAARSNATPDKIYDVTIKAEEEPSSTDKIINTAKTIGKLGAETAAVVGGITLARKTPYVKKLIQQYKDAKINKANAIKFDETLSFGEKIMNTIDTKNITENALKKGFIDEQTANNLYRNTYQQTINSFDTGTLYVGDKLIQTDYAPRLVLRDIQAKAVQNPVGYKFFNAFMNKSRQLQAKTYEYNRLNKTDYTVYDILSKPGLADIISTPNDGKSFAKTYKEAQFLHKMIYKDGTFIDTLQKISDINNKMLDVFIETGEYSPKYADILRKNRNMFDLNLYLPGIFEADETKGFGAFLETLDNSFSNDALTKNAKTFASNKRLDTKTLANAAPWDQTFETNYKNTLKSLLDNKHKRDLVNALEKSRDEKVYNLVDQINEIKNTTIKETAYRDAIKLDKLTQQVKDEFDAIEYLGEINTNKGKINPNKNPLQAVLNKYSDNLTDGTNRIKIKENEIENQHVIDAYANAQNKAKFIAIPTDDTIKLYKVNDWFGQIVQQNPQQASLIYNTLRGTTNAMKSFVTGKFNPLFSMVTGSYTMTDQLTGLKSINKALNTDISKTALLKNALTKTTEPFMYKYLANEIENTYKGIESGKIKRTPEVLKKLRKQELALRNSDINQIKATGATFQGRYPVDVYKRKNGEIDTGFIVNSPKTLQKLIKKVENSKLINNNIINNEINGAKFTQYALESLRDAPTLGLYKSFSPFFKTADGKIDSNKIMQISRLLDKYTATGSLTPSQNKWGKVAQGFNDIVPYFSDMLSENMARGRMLNFKNITDHVANLFDENVKLSTELKNIAKGVTGNDFVKAGTSVVAIPTILASMWNHSSQENEDAYNALPDKYKNKGIVFVNAINGEPIIIPMTQSLMWLVTGIREGLTDPILSLGENKYNYGDNLKYRLEETAETNWSISMPPAFGTLFNAMGYRAPNTTELFKAMKDKQFALDNYKLYNLNYNEGNYYENGIFSPKQRATIQTLFGNPGAAVSEAIDVTTNTKNPIKGIEAGLNKYLTTGRNLVNPKASTWNATSEQLYKKKEQFKRATHTKNLTPDQNKVLDLIRMYQNSRFNLIDKKIKDIRKQINEIKQTGRYMDEDLPYMDQQKSIDDLTKEINLLQSHKLKEYENLDKLLKQQYNTTYDMFMKGIK